MKTRLLIQFLFFIIPVFFINACTSLKNGSSGKELTVIIKKSTVSSPHILHKIREDLVFKKYIRSVNFINIPEPVIEIDMEPGSVRAANLDYDDIKKAILKEFRRVPFMKSQDRSVIIIKKGGFESVTEKSGSERLGNIIVSKGQPFTRLKDIARIKYTFRHHDERYYSVPVYKLKISYDIKNKKDVFDCLAGYEKLYGIEIRIIDEG